VWLARWGIRLDGPAPGDLSGLRASFDEAHAALIEFVGSRSVQDFERNVDYTDTQGDAHSVPLWQLVMHVINHGTHHRAEAGWLLGQAGHSPGDLDLVYHFLRPAEAP
jgi:uncharacterized damage-inducible protein DinB